mmetsp:Transcript_972/g.4119  ORF Transcript_972/g.4119 Transcript_972/m.4119 type:complete len:259 (+) Transcript_972:1143-1919(+)
MVKEFIIPRHVLVEALVHRCAVRCPPVALDKPVEADDIFEMPLQEFVVLAAVRSVHQIVRAHEGGDTSFHRGDEGPVVGLEEAPLITVCIYGVSIGFLIVQYEMLCHRQEAVVLYGSDVRPSHLRPENRVFATDVFSIAPSFRHAVEIETWSENHVRSFASELLSKSRAPLVHKIHIEGGPHCKKTGPAGDLSNLARIHGSESLCSILHVQWRDAEPRDRRSVSNEVSSHQVKLLPSKAVHHVHLLFQSHFANKLLSL